MKCPNCGAEIKTESKFCEFCGTQISYDMQREQEQLNKQGCPKCGSSNIQFKRENHGEVRDKKSKKIIHRTVGFCKDCGYTWYPNSNNQTQSKNNMVWWVLGWLFFFPAPVMVLIWRKKNTWDVKVKTAVTVIFWLFILIAGRSNRTNSSVTDTAQVNVSQEVAAIEEQSETSNVPEETVVTENASEVETINTPEATTTPEIPASTGNPVELTETTGQKNALKKAESYLKISAFSREGLIKQLEYEGYSTDEAAYATDNCNADWKEQALKKAIDYLNVSAFSKDGLIKQLEYEEYSNEQAVYAVDNCGADWNEQAAKKAADYLNLGSFSKDSLIQQLEFEGFTSEQAIHGAETNGY